MAVTNKKSKQKSGTKKSAKGRTTSANKDYLASKSAKSSKGSSNKSSSSKTSSQKGGGRSSNTRSNSKGRSNTKNSRTAANSRINVKSGNKKSVTNRNIYDNRGIHGEIAAIIILVLGVFFAVAMHTELTGVIGDFIGKFFRGMFGVVGYLIPYTMIITSCMVFLKRERPFTKKHMICLIVIFFMINLINAERFMANFSLENADFAMVYSMGNNLVGGGVLGMYPGKLIETAIGPVGIYLFTIAAIIISVVIAADFSLIYMFQSVADKKQEAKLRREEEREYYLQQEEEQQLIAARNQTEEVQEDFFAEFEPLKDEPEFMGVPRKSGIDSRNADFISKGHMEKRRNMKEKLENNRRRNNILELVKNEFFSTEKDDEPVLNSNEPVDNKSINQPVQGVDNSLDKLLERAAIDSETGEIIEEPVIENEQPELHINISGVDMNENKDFDWSLGDEEVQDERGHIESPFATGDPVKNYPMKSAKDLQMEDEEFDWSIPGEEYLSKQPIEIHDKKINGGNDEPVSEKISEKNALSNLENQIASNKSGTAVCGAVASPGTGAGASENTGENHTGNNTAEVHRNRKRTESQDQRKEREKSEMEIQATMDSKKDQATHYEIEYELPDLSLLNPPPHKEKQENDVENLRNNAMTLERTLKSFNVDAKVINVTKGSSVTRYEVQPAVGTKVSSIVRLSDDIALNLRAKSIRMEAPIPGKAAVGIEIENESREMVSVSEMIGSEEFKNSTSKLSFVVGKDIAGKTVVADLAKMPHMLIAGATGSGKSVCINTIIASILYHAKPNEVKLLLIDPKMVELGNYNGIPHLLIPVVTDSNKAAAALNWAVSEMTGRYKKFAENSVREIKGYNKLMRKNGKPEEAMSQIVIVIDELADLMMVASSLVEEAICRLAQLARAAGIHLIVATQRPSVDVVTGLIKANIPSRIAFMVSSQVDSRTIIDMAGAEKLVGNGDMLFKPQNLDKPIRVQGPFISDEEVENIIQFIKAQNIDVEYDQKVIKEIKNKDKDEKSAADSEDVLMEDAIRTVIKAKQASVSMLQRRFRIGYNRAARIVDDMEMAGIVGPQDGSRPRTVLVDESYFVNPDEVDEELEENNEELEQKIESSLEAE